MTDKIKSPESPQGLFFSFFIKYGSVPPPVSRPFHYLYPHFSFALLYTQKRRFSSVLFPDSFLSILTHNLYLPMRRVILYFFITVVISYFISYSISVKYNYFFVAVRMIPDSHITFMIFRSAN